MRAATVPAQAAAAILLILTIEGAAQSQMMVESSAEQLFILSDKNGRGMTIGQQIDSREGFSASTLTGQEIAANFKALCLDTAFDSAKFELAAAESNLSLKKREITLPALKKGVAFNFGDFGSESARASLWNGDESGLKDRPILIRSRGALVSSGYGPFKAEGKQCNFDIKVANFSSVDGLATELSNYLGVQPAKLVSKPSFGDGHWETKIGTDAVRVSFDAVDLKESSALVHLVVQIKQGVN